MNRPAVRVYKVLCESESKFECRFPVSQRPVDTTTDVGAAGNGYVFQLSSCRPDAVGGANLHYLVVAYPVVRDRTGSNSFCSDETGLVKTDVPGSRRHSMINGSAWR